MGKLTPPTSLAAIALNKAESWAARRATWRLANRGDTRVAAEKRFFKLEMKSLRRELQLADLLDRRAEYVAQREAASTARQVLSPAELAAQREAAAARRQARLEQKDKSEARRLKAKALSREQAVRAVGRREAIKTEEKEAWLENFLKENDVSGKRATGWAGAGRKMAQVKSWFNPEAETAEEIEARIIRQNVIGYRKSPIDKWNNAARESQDEELTHGFGVRRPGNTAGAFTEPPKAGSSVSAADAEEDGAATAAKEFEAALTAASSRNQLSYYSAPADPPDTLVQLEKPHASDDGTSGWTRFDYVPNGNGEPGGRLTLREKVALLDGESEGGASDGVAAGIEAPGVSKGGARRVEETPPADAAFTRQLRLALEIASSKDAAAEDIGEKPPKKDE